jgi:hypothetical protein
LKVDECFPGRAAQISGRSGTESSVCKDRESARNWEQPQAAR